MISKTVLKSVVWRDLESALAFCIFQLLCFSLHPTDDAPNASGGTISRFQLVAPPGQRMGPLCLWQCFYWYTSEEWWWYSALMQCHTHHCYDNSFSSGGWMYRVIRSWIDIETILLRTRLKKDSTTGKTKLSLFSGSGWGGMRRFGLSYL